jgi:hypothetical protein
MSEDLIRKLKQLKVQAIESDDDDTDLNSISEKYNDLDNEVEIPKQPQFKLSSQAEKGLDTKAKKKGLELVECPHINKEGIICGRKTSKPYCSYHLHLKCHLEEVQSKGITSLYEKRRDYHRNKYKKSKPSEPKKEQEDEQNDV